MNQVEGTSHREVNGIPVYWSAAPGPWRAELMFRVGAADESATARGITHLVEHVALSTLIGRRPRLLVNGSVGLDLTVFEVTGDDPSDVRDHLEDVCTALTSLDAARLGHERAVLHRELAHRGPSLVSQLLALHYGLVGYGLAALDEEDTVPALRAGQVAAWASARFTAGAAAVAVTGPEPLDLRLPLPAGRRHELPATHAMNDVQLAAPVDDTSVVLSFVVRDEPSARAALDVLGHRFTATLRHERGLSYSPVLVATPVGAQDLHGVVVVDVGAAFADEVLHQVVSMTEDLAAASTSVAELADVEALAAIRRGATPPPSPARAAAEQQLTARPDREADGWSTGEGRVTPETVRRAAASIVASARVLTDGESFELAELGRDVPSDSAPEFPPPVDPPSEPSGRPPTDPGGPPTDPGGPLTDPGRVFTIGGRWRQRHVLTVRSSGVDVTRRGHATQVAFAECVKVRWWHDGHRELITRNGRSLFIAYAPGVGREAIAALDRAVPPRLFSCADGPGRDDDGGLLDLVADVPVLPPTRRRRRRG